MMHLRPLLYPALLLATLASPGCGNEVGPPHPDPLPDVTKARTSALMRPPYGTGSGPVTVVGLPGCVAGKGLLTVETLGTTSSTTSTDQGTFNLTVNSKIDAQLAFRYQGSQPAFRTVPGAGVTAPRPPGPIPGVPPVTVLGGGRVRVQGRTTVGPGGPLFGMNPRSGEVVLATSVANGDFQLELGAVSGDTLAIYDDTDPLGPDWAPVVP